MGLLTLRTTIARSSPKRRSTNSNLEPLADFDDASVVDIHAGTVFSPFFSPAWLFHLHHAQPQSVDSEAIGKSSGFYEMDNDEPHPETFEAASLMVWGTER